MAAAPDTIVLVHGLWMTPTSWEHWKERYESKGHRVLAPAWRALEHAGERKTTPAGA